jgi:HlyD family secretion protein
MSENPMRHGISSNEQVLQSAPLSQKAPTEKTAESVADSAQQELLGLLRQGRKKSRRVTYIVLAVLLAAGTAGGWWLYNANQPKADEEIRYRQYTVERGDVTVGFTESSSVSLVREQVLFPVSATVEEVLVKAGSSVKEGDPLLQLSVDEIEEGMDVYRLQLEQAQLELEQARLNQKSKLLQAEHTLQTAILEGDLAESVHEMTAEQLQAKLDTAQKNLEDSLETLSTYRNYENNYDDDYYDLSVLSRRMATYETQYKGYLDSFDEVSALELQLAHYTALKAATSDAAKIDEYAKKIGEIQADIAIIGDGKDSTQLYSLYKSAYADYTDALSRYREELSDFNEEYPIKYGDDEEVEKQIETLNDKVDSYALAVKEATLTMQTGSLSALQKQVLSKLAADTAKAQYNLTAMQLEQSVDKATQVVDQTVRRIAEIEESVPQDGIVRAPCTGVVASVVVEAGDSIKVTYDEDTDTLTQKNLLVLNDISTVTVPVTVSEEDILHVYLGQPARVTMKAFDGQTFAAEVDTIAPEAARAGAAAVSYTVNLRYTGTNTQTMYEGMSAQITLIRKEVNDVLFVSNNAVTNKNGIATVLRQKQDGTPEEVEVKTGFSNGQMVEIISGLKQGDILLAPSGVSL